MALRHRPFRNVPEVVREILASADPFYRGPHRSTPPPIHEHVRPLDPRKTARDPGRIEEEPFPRREDRETAPGVGPGPVGPETDVPWIATHRREER